jgi:hypothetical protein
MLGFLAAPFFGQSTTSDWLFAPIAVLIMLPFGVNFPRGIARKISAFTRDCYLRVGPGGVAIRIPRYKFFGRFHIAEYAFAWNQIENVRGVIYSLGYRKLEINLRDGTSLELQSWLFAESLPKIVDRLLAIQAANAAR